MLQNLLEQLNILDRTIYKMFKGPANRSDAFQLKLTKNKMNSRKFEANNLTRNFPLPKNVANKNRRL